MIHSPRLLVLDEPFESVDPVSAQVVIDILKKFAAAGGTVVLSSHSMDLIERDLRRRRDHRRGAHAGERPDDRGARRRTRSRSGSSSWPAAPPQWRAWSGCRASPTEGSAAPQRVPPPFVAHLRLGRAAGDRGSRRARRCSSSASRVTEFDGEIVGRAIVLVGAEVTLGAFLLPADVLAVAAGRASRVPRVPDPLGSARARALLAADPGRTGGAPDPGGSAARPGLARLRRRRRAPRSPRHRCSCSQLLLLVRIGVAVGAWLHRRAAAEVVGAAARP